MKTARLVYQRVRLIESWKQGQPLDVECPLPGAWRVVNVNRTGDDLVVVVWALDGGAA